MSNYDNVMNYRKPILFNVKGKNKMLKTTEKSVETTKTVNRTINGNVKTLSIFDALKSDINKRLGYLDYQFELLGKTTLINDVTSEQKKELIEKIETTICGFYDKAMNELQKSKSAKTSKTVKSYV